MPFPIMTTTLHITSGDIAGNSLAKSGVPGEILVWRDILYDGPRKPGWPDDATLRSRAGFLERLTGGGLTAELILETFRAQYHKLETVDSCDELVLWFDACLFDQAMLSHILACLRFLGRHRADLICIDSFPGIEPFHGLGQLSPEQFASARDRRRPLTDEQFTFAEYVDRAFALHDTAAFLDLSHRKDAPLPRVPAAVTRWLQEQPDDATGLGRLELLALDAIRSGCRTPNEIYARVSAHDTPPQFWGDNILWAKINALADRKLARIEGPSEKLPQWEGISDLKLFRIHPIETAPRSP